MTWDVTLAVFAFALVGSITPGPNNLMLLASGVNHGLRRTVPHVAGVSLGVALMVLALGAGVAELYARHPASAVALKVASTLYMLWLAWKIATAAAPDPGEFAAPCRGRRHRGAHQGRKAALVVHQHFERRGGGAAGAGDVAAQDVGGSSEAVASAAAPARSRGRGAARARASRPSAAPAAAIASISRKT
jgi:hypothetical protein